VVLSAGQKPRANVSVGSQCDLTGVAALGAKLPFKGLKDLGIRTGPATLGAEVA
jgi:hypothetical protein